jgi:hypothetical protein
MCGQLYTDNPKIKLLIVGAVYGNPAGYKEITCISLLSQRYAKQK